MNRRVTLQQLVALLAAMLVLAAPVRTFAQEGKPTLYMNSDLLMFSDGTVQAAWFAYGTELFAHANNLSFQEAVPRSKNEANLAFTTPASFKERLTQSPAKTFSIELAARTRLVTQWERLKAKAAKPDPYLNDLLAIHSAGFLAEYVALELANPAWSDTPSGLKINEYKTWKATNLTNHTAQTYVVYAER